MTEEIKTPEEPEVIEEGSDQEPMTKAERKAKAKAERKAEAEAAKNKDPKIPEEPKEDEPEETKKLSTKKTILMIRNGMETKCSQKALKSFLEAGWLKV